MVDNKAKKERTIRFPAAIKQRLRDWKRQREDAGESASVNGAVVTAVTLWFACGSPMEPEEVQRVGALAKVKRTKSKTHRYKGPKQKEENVS